MARMTAARALVESLRAQGVDTIFGIISSHTMEIFDALYDHQDAIRFISTRHEQAAAMMADGYARVTGKPGICLTSTGPGAANSMGGLGEAYDASSPVLTITSTAEEQLYERGLGTMHETKNQLDMLATVTQRSVHISRPEEAPEQVQEAFELFEGARQRPIAIEIPSDVQAQEAEMTVPGPVRVAAPAADPAAVEAAAEILSAGRRVGVMAGAGVHRSGAGRELTRLVERLGAPVFTTANGKGAIPEDHPLSLGMYGGEYNFPPGGLEDPRQTFANSLDVLLVAGSSLSYFRAKSQGLRQPPQLIHLDIDAAPMDKWYETTVRLVGDARIVLKELNAALENKPGPGQTAGKKDGSYAEEVRAVREKIREYKRKTMPNETRIMEAIRAVAARGRSLCRRRRDLQSPRGQLLSGYMRGAELSDTGLGRSGLRIAGCGWREGRRSGTAGDLHYRRRGIPVQYSGVGNLLCSMGCVRSCWFSMTTRGVCCATTSRAEATAASLPATCEIRTSQDWPRLTGPAACRSHRCTEMVQALEQALEAETVTVIDVKTPQGFANFE